jgi:hypothetical protein
VVGLLATITLKIGGVWSYETLISYHITVRCHSPENRDLNFQVLPEQGAGKYERQLQLIAAELIFKYSFIYQNVLVLLTIFNEFLTLFLSKSYMNIFFVYNRATVVQEIIIRLTSLLQHTALILFSTCEINSLYVTSDQ